MPIETRYYDTEGDGYWFKLEPVTPGESMESAVVSLMLSEADYAAVWLSAKDVEKLVEELKQYLPAKSVGEVASDILYPKTINYNTSYPDQNGN